MLIARASEARELLPEALAERGAKVDVVALYETVREDPDPEAIEAAQSADYVTFTSSSTVRNLLAAVGDRFPRDARVVSIGPVTSEAAREAGLEVARRGRAPRHRRGWSRRWSPTPLSGWAEAAGIRSRGETAARAAGSRSARG